MALMASSQCGADPKVVSVPPARGPIRVDGRLDEAAWKSAGHIGSFKHYLRAAPVANRSQVFLLYDPSALYVAYKCSESNMPALRADVTAHDGSVWEDDAADFFLDPKADGASFLQFIANTAGTKYDALGNDPHGFNPAWEAQAVTRGDGWVLEMRIPFSEIGTESPEPGDRWLGNFCREEQPSSELSCWNATMGSFAAAGAFGEIIFGSLADRLRKDVMRLEAELTEGAGIASEAGTQDLSNRLLKLKSQIPKSGDIATAEYLAARELLDEAAGALSSLKARGRRAAMGDPDYLVWETSPWKHYTAAEDISDIVEQTSSLDVLALVGQTESRVLMISNLTTRTLSARILIAGAAEEVMEILLPAFVRTADGRPFPDALVPPDPIGQITIPAGETRQVWLNFRAAKEGVYDGTLTISPLTASANDSVVALHLRVVAPPRSLPKPIAFTWDYLGDAETRGMVDRYMNTMLDHGVTAFLITGLRYMPRPKADDQGNLLEPTDWSRFKEQVKLKWKPGRKLYISVDVWEKAAERPLYNGKFDSPGWRVAFKTVIREMAGVLREMGLSHEDYWINPVDESIDERYIAIARLIKEIDPRIRIISDSVGASLDEVKEADKLTDHWVPHFNNFRAEGTNESISYLKSNGKPLGMYYYSEGANEKAQDSYNHYLWRLWYAYSQGLDGLIGYWTASQHYGDPWNRHQTDASYDPSLFYPGNGCVIPSRRWEAWRRGIEDIALLRLCEESGIDKALISLAVDSVMNAPTDPDAADRAREDLVRSLAER